MTDHIQNISNSDISTPKEIVFTWKHLLLRGSLIALIASILSYLQAIEVINVASGVEAQLLAPAIVGLILAIVNFKFLWRIAVFFLPVWFAAAVAIEFAGIFLAEMFHNGFEKSTAGLTATLLEYLPAAIAGHWLYSGYSRFSASKSIFIYLLILFFSIFVAFLVYTGFDIYLVEAVYLTVISILLSYMHMGRVIKVKK